MRSALWLLSAPLVLSGLAWAVGVADDGSTPDTPRAAASGKSSRGNIFYFSRSGKSNDGKSSDSTSDDSQSDDSQPSDAKSSGAKSNGAGTSDAKKPVNAKPGTARPGDAKPGDATAKKAAKPVPKALPSASATHKMLPSREWTSPAPAGKEDATTPAMPQPQKYVRSKAELLPPPPAEQKTKNYYRELFEAGEVEENDVMDRNHGGTQLAGGAMPEEVTIDAASHDEPAEHDADRDASKQAVADAPVAKTPTRKAAVVSAKYEERQGQTADQRIQQVSQDVPANAAPKSDTQAKAAPKARPAVAQRPVAAKPGTNAKPAQAPASQAPASNSKRVPIDPLEMTAPARESLPELAPDTPVATNAAPTESTAEPKHKGHGTVQPAVVVAPETKAHTAPRVEHAVMKDGEHRTSHAETPVINLRWLTRGEVNVGQECRCGLEVKNNSAVQASDVLVEAYFPRSVRLLSAEPYPSDSRDHLTWRFETLAAGEEKLIEIVMIPAKRGELATSATVRFTGVAATVLNVEEPQLLLSIKGPQEVTVGEAATQVVTVSNPGTGVARDIIVQAVVPEGLEHARGKKVQMSIGSLSPGESREVRLALAAVGGGDQILQVEARGSSNLLQLAESQIKVSAPRVEVALTGPGLRYVNRHAQYAVIVTNKGAAETNNVRVTQIVPHGFEFVKADHGGVYNSATRTVTWFLGQIDAGQASHMLVELAAKEAGLHQHKVNVTGENGSAAEALVETKVEGSAALVMEVGDTDDPVEVKSQTSYEIRVRNDGSKAAQNLVVACHLPQGVELVDAEGPTPHHHEKGVLTFQNIPELGPQKSLSYRIRVVGTVPGNLRFKAKLTTDSSPEPQIVVEEMTKFYAD